MENIDGALWLVGVGVPLIVLSRFTTSGLVSAIGTACVLVGAVLFALEAAKTEPRAGEPPHDGSPTWT